MNCEEVRNLLLEGDPDAWEGEQAYPSQLNHHIAACSECRALCDSLQTGMVRLATEYAELSPRQSAAAVSEKIISSVDARRSRIRANRTRRSAYLAVGAAAATGAFVLATQKRELAVEPEVAQPISVSVPANQNAIVFETKDPNITVVWLLSGDN